MAAAKAKEQTLEERLGQAIEALAAVVAEIDDAGRDAVEAAEREVWAKLRRYSADRDELQDLARRERELQGELEDLPSRHGWALLNDDEAGVAAAKARHADIKAELAAIATRRPELEHEVKELGGPNTARLPEPVKDAGVEVFLRSRLVPPALDAALAPLAKLDREVCAPIGVALDTAKARARIHTGSMQNLSSEIQHHPDMVAAKKRREAEEAARGR